MKRNLCSTFVRTAYAGFLICIFLFGQRQVRADMLVANSNSVLRYSDTGAFLGTFVPPGSGGLILPTFPIFGPDGNLYVLDYYGNSILRYNGTTGAFIDAFVSSGSGLLSAPAAATFGPDGNLYVGEWNSHAVKRFNGVTGAPMGVFTSGGSIVIPVTIAFGPDGNMYVGDEINVLKYNGTTGAYMGIFIPSGRGGLTHPSILIFAPDGYLYLAGAYWGIGRFNATTGEFISQFVPGTSVRSDGGFAFGPDGNAYVGYDYETGSSDFVSRFNGQTGSLIDVFIPPGTIGLVRGIVFMPGSGVPLQVKPNHGGNGGSVTVQIIGSAFQTGATVSLTGVGPDIVGTNTHVPYPSALSTTFDLTGATLGVRNIVITAPNSASSTLPGAFIVEQGGAPQIWVDIVGRNKIRSGLDQTYYVSLGNTGNIDSDGEFVSIAVPTSVGLEFPSTGPVVDLTRSSQYTIATFASPHVAAGETQNLPVLLNSQNDFRIRIQHESSSALSTMAAPTSQLSDNSLNLPNQRPILLFTPGIYDGCRPALHAARCAACDNKWDNIQILEGSALAADQEYQLDKSQFLAQALQDVTTFGLGNLPAWTGNVLAVLGILFNDDPSLSTLYSKMNAAKTNLDNLNRFLCAAVDSYIQCVNNTCGGGQQGTIPDSPDDQDVDIGTVTSLDPNAKVGSAGVGLQQYISGATPLRYGLFFGNEDNATAPAQQVSITDQLDTKNDSLDTLSLGPIAFGSQLLTPPPFQTSYSTTVDLRPVTNLLVAVNGNMNSSTGLLTWTFQSVDPTTMQPPTDPTTGFLPPGVGGAAFFTVMPKQGMTTNTQVQNQATIVFDVNAPINTQTWTNTLDNTPPTSHVVALPSSEWTTGFTVSWIGTDIGSGIRNYTIYVSDNGGPLTAWITSTTTTTANYAGQFGHTYSFYSVATDNVGNLESAKTTAEATTSVVQETTPPVITPAITGTQGQNGWYLTGVAVSWTVTDPESGIASSTGCANSTLTTDTAGALLTCSATNGAGLTNSASVTIKIDQTPPTFSGMPKAGCSLRSEDHKFVRVATVTAADALSGLASFGVTATSNEQSDPNDVDDIRIKGTGLGPRVVELRANELRHHDDDRYHDHDKRHHETEIPKIYTIVANATDLAGNSRTSTATCTVENRWEK